MVNSTPKRTIAPEQRLTEALGISENYHRFQQEVARVAGAMRPVILFGDRGTGIELAAARIH